MLGLLKVRMAHVRLKTAQTGPGFAHAAVNVTTGCQSLLLGAVYIPGLMQ